MIGIQFASMILLPSLMTVILHVMGKKQNTKKYSVFTGILFGLCAIYGTEFGVDTGMAIFNTRDAAVICAGLFFGAPSAIVAAIIGSVERYLAPFWGVGAYTQLACSLATLFAGLLTAFVVKFFFNEKPKWFQGLSMASFIEVFHMTMVFVTHPRDLHTAFTVIQNASLVMIVINSASVVLAIVLVDLIDKNKITLPDSKKIAVQFNYGLSIAIVIVFSISVLFISILEKTITLTDTEALLLFNIQDVESQIDDGFALSDSTQFRHIGTGGYVIIADEDMEIISNMEEFKGLKLQDIGFSSQKPESRTLLTGTINGVESFFLYDVHNYYNIIALLPVAEAKFSENVTVSLFVFIELLVFAIFYLMIIFLTDILVIRNINSVNDKLSQITQGNLDVKLQNNESREFESLSFGINNTVDKLKTLIAEANARIDKELEFARRIQTESLPTVLPSNLNNGIEISASMTAAREVGGDFYDFFYTKEGKLVFLIADVSGKGIAAALFMMRAKALIRGIADNLSFTVEEIATKANNSLCENNEAGLFVTAWLGMLDPKTGILDYVCAGHNPPVLVHQDGKKEFLRNRSGLVLAGLEDVSYKPYQRTLEKGDLLFLYTDGVTEATDLQGTMFGDKRLEKALENNKDVSSLPGHVLSDINGFVGEAQQFDDITMLVLRYNGFVPEKRS